MPLTQALIDTWAERVKRFSAEGLGPRCKHCGLPDNRHGLMMGHCMRKGKVLQTTFEPIAR